MATEKSDDRKAAIVRKQRLNVAALQFIELILAVFMVGVVIWGLVTLAITIPWVDGSQDYAQFRQMMEAILSDILLLVVGLELAGLLVHRKIELLIDIVLFVVARKMLISAYAATEILMSVAALAALYAVRKYLLICPGCLNVQDEERGER